jgi:2-polyprenyl-3-methyl-5-hydroxy-6-metoxy-1,4-benzoquinol methylase
MSERLQAVSPELQEMADRFEAAVFAQTAVTSDHYDTDYFADDWREEANRYDVDTRRRIEARNPQLIKDVFEPERVLDVGCGPGFLMLFLHELGIDVQGVDFAEASMTLAPEEMRERITIGEVTDGTFPDQGFDLVICREVMEHLSVLQVRRTVAQICRCSSRFVYVTTRYHPQPEDLLDLTTDFETDPTHITLMSKELLRVLFVLEGFKRRANLESAMDWADKRRVLVYERTGF